MKDTGHTVSGETLLGLLIFFVTVLTVVSASMSLKASPRPPKTAGTGSARAAAQAANQSPADFVLTDAKIYTEDSEHRTVEALAIRDGKIIFTGTAAEVAKLIGPKTKVERAGGKLVLPGLIDAHIHPMGIVDFGGCDLESKARTLAEIAAFVHACIERMHVPPGQWVAVSDWEYGGGNHADPDHPTLRAALDAASATNPIVMT
ncbi:MAG: amidohydrolase family protein, partial [Candidatus Acidiferrales bacterium]